MRHGLVLALLIAFTALAGSAADAALRKKFDTAEFAAAQEAGTSIVVMVSAPWCPTCKAQQPVIDRLAIASDYMNVLVLEIDFDTGRDDWRPLGVRNQSTLIAYQGKTETARSVGDTSPDKIEALFKSAL